MGGCLVHNRQIDLISVEFSVTRAKNNNYVNQFKLFKGKSLPPAKTQTMPRHRVTNTNFMICLWEPTILQPLETSTSCGMECFLFLHMETDC